MFISSQEISHNFVARMYLRAKMRANCEWDTGYTKSNIGMP